MMKEMIMKILERQRNLRRNLFNDSEGMNYGL